MAAKRKHLQVRLSPEAREGLDRFCTTHGITATALIETIVRALNTTTTWTVADVVERARALDAERRSR